MRRLSESGLTSPELADGDDRYRPLRERVGSVVREQGLPGLIRRAVAKGTAPIRYHPRVLSGIYLPWLRHRRRDWRFTLAGHDYPYFYHSYNTTWRVERAVEVPPVLAALDRRPHARILEVGNVLAHYTEVRHDVVDRYESAPHVIREDAATYRPEQPFDLILSVSTLEHIGWDEQPRQPEKAVRTIDHLLGLLAPGGAMLVTAPCGYNPALDRAVAAGRLPFEEIHFLRRVSADNRWEGTDADTALAAPYGRPWNGAQAVWFGLIGRVFE